MNIYLGIPQLSGCKTWWICDAECYDHAGQLYERAAVPIDHVGRANERPSVVHERWMGFMSIWATLMIIVLSIKMAAGKSPTVRDSDSHAALLL
ncbi:hypothetical protein [Sporosarcina sp.]|uniref:hypothetical protein n=1 Tax=Sporosarcina sp. TaxID=49982 RepID=UPI0026260C03|nr:hypothetical protein [Sporosarcina sp.]